MPIKNYTTKIPSARTIAEIQQMLGEHGAQSIGTHYQDKKVSAITFEIRSGELVLRYLLPCRWQQIYALLNYDEKAKRVLREMRLKLDEERCRAIGWRIVRDWLDAQLALIEAEMAEMEEVMLPYMLARDGRTAYEMLGGGRLLLEPKP